MKTPDELGTDQETQVTMWRKAGNVLALIGLSLASILSFFSMGIVVPTYFFGAISYQLKFIVPAFLAGFFFLSQLIPGYFARTRKLMLATLLFSGIFVGVLFTILKPLTGPIYGAACALGNFVGHKARDL